VADGRGELVLGRQGEAQGVFDQGTGFVGGFLGLGGAKQTAAACPASKPATAKPLSRAEQAVAEEQRAKASTLWTVKLLFLLFYGSLGSVMPYLPVYYHALGLPGACCVWRVLLVKRDIR
jgi:hypothetical protein